MKADSAAIEAAAACLAAGGLVAFPTETVYGLGADARNGEAVARLYAAKGRPAFNPLIAHVADARRRAPARALRCRRRAAGGRVLAGAADAGAAAAARLPGRRPGARRPRQRGAARAGASGWRRRCSRPSAGRSWRRRPTAPAMSRRPAPRMCSADLRGRIDMILDGGPCAVGVESTIVACLGRADLAAARRRAARGDRARARPRAGRCRRAPTTRRWRPACWPRITRPRRGCG